MSTKENVTLDNLVQKVSADFMLDIENVFGFITLKAKSKTTKDITNNVKLALKLLDIWNKSDNENDFADKVLTFFSSEYKFKEFKYDLFGTKKEEYVIPVPDNIFDVIKIDDPEEILTKASLDQDSFTRMMILNEIFYSIYTDIVKEGNIKINDKIISALIYIFKEQTNALETKANVLIMNDYYNDTTKNSYNCYINQRDYFHPILDEMLAQTFFYFTFSFYGYAPSRGLVVNWDSTRWKKEEAFPVSTDNLTTERLLSNLTIRKGLTTRLNFYIARELRESLSVDPDQSRQYFEPLITDIKEYVQRYYVLIY